MSDAEVAHELDAAGIDAAQIPSAERLLAKAAPPASVTSIAPASRVAPRRGPWALWLAAAAVAALTVGIVGTEAQEIVAWWKGPEAPAPVKVTPGPVQVTPAPSLPTALVRAAALRKEAAQACAMALWGTCGQRLDDARALDPEGEHQDDVRVMRARIDYEGKQPSPGPFYGTKPGPEPAPKRQP
jgi:hypothetical protein